MDSEFPRRPTGDDLGPRSSLFRKTRRRPCPSQTRPTAGCGHQPDPFAQGARLRIESRHTVERYSDRFHYCAESNFASRAGGGRQSHRPFAGWRKSRIHLHHERFGRCAILVQFSKPEGGGTRADRDQRDVSGSDGGNPNIVSRLVLTLLYRGCVAFSPRWCDALHNGFLDFAPIKHRPVPASQFPAGFQDHRADPAFSDPSARDGRMHQDLRFRQSR